MKTSKPKKVKLVDLSPKVHKRLMKVTELQYNIAIGAVADTLKARKELVWAKKKLIELYEKSVK